MLSVNYIHELDRSVTEFKDMPIGQKFWWFIPRKHSHIFEKFCRLLLKEMNYTCPNFIAHRFLMANPTLLKDIGIDVHYALQEEGQYTVVFPRVYHCGKSQQQVDLQN